MSRIFINNVTVIDYAYISAGGVLVGGSCNLSVILEGNSTLTPEAVVIDFGSGKRLIKELIDDKEEGYDHKLWAASRFVTKDEDESVVIETPHVLFKGPRNALKVVENPDCLFATVEKDLENYLNEKLKEYSIKVSCILDKDPQTQLAGDVVARFRYTHGLRYSTSWGCQNIAHGHLSFISVDGNPDLAFDLAERFDGTYFADKKTVVGDKSKHIEFRYTTKDRGEFYLELDKNAHKIVLLDAQPTIENLACYVGTLINEPFAISEGLSKGAIGNV